MCSSTPAATALFAKYWSNRARLIITATGCFVRSSRGSPLGGWKTAPWIVRWANTDCGSTPSIASPLRLTTPEQWLGTPTWGCSSRRTTFAPFLAASRAAWLPATPAPTTMIRFSSEEGSKELSVVFELNSQSKTLEFPGELLHNLKVQRVSPGSAAVQYDLRLPATIWEPDRVDSQD